MPEQMELRQEIEALATKIVVEDLSSEAGFEQSMLALAGAVRGVRDRADAGGCREVARIASELCATLDSPGIGARDALSHALETGVAAMQQALESCSVPAAAPEPETYSLAQDPELLADFVLESREHLAAIESVPSRWSRTREMPKPSIPYFALSTPSRDWPVFWNWMPCGRFPTTWRPCWTWRATAR